MVTRLQALLLLVYRIALRSGVLQLPGMRAIYERTYDVYKQFLEAPYVSRLKPYVLAGTIVIDVGANVGFFTSRFAAWTGRDGRVLAIEPERRNFERLQAKIRTQRLESVVESVHAAAIERAGEVVLAVDPYHPAGHALAAEGTGGGVRTRAVTLDDLVQAGAPRRVSLIKIDVQGAELRVLQGAVRTIGSFRPALLIELDDAALRAQGASVDAVVAFLEARGYEGRLVTAKGFSPLTPGREIVARSLAAGYCDALFTPAVETGVRHDGSAAVSTA